jgi:hypothetical protein
VFVSSKDKKNKTKQDKKQKTTTSKKSLETALWMSIESAPHLPPTVSHLLLQALFMQISGTSFILT